MRHLLGKNLSGVATMDFVRSTKLFEALRRAARTFTKINGDLFEGLDRGHPEHGCGKLLLQQPRRAALITLTGTKDRADQEDEEDGSQGLKISCNAFP